MVAGVHFPLNTLPADIGYKALAVNLSDLAAMGATPLGARLSLTAPGPDDSWLDQFHTGFNHLAEEFSLASEAVKLVRGDLVVTVQVYGAVPAGEAITRGGASQGDTILITGTPGDAGGGLACALGQLEISEPEREYLEGRLNRPTPRVREGVAIRGRASAAIDVSDGLIADLCHLTTASQVGACLDVSKLPLSEPLRNCFDLEPSQQLALSSGDDYELLFTCASRRANALRDHIESMGTRCTVIGFTETTPGLRLTGGEFSGVENSGWEHFR